LIRQGAEERERRTTVSDNVDVVLRTFRAVEQRDAEELFSLYHPDVEFHDAPSLPYGGSVRGKAHLRELLERAPDGTWLGTWGPLQPTEAERSMDPRVVAANDAEVVVLYRQRAVDSAGNRLDAPVLGLYEVRDGKFARAQMFHFDTAALVDFLTRAKGGLASEAA
jgi:ketosteroid isomerase-like protein